VNAHKCRILAMVNRNPPFVRYTSKRDGRIKEEISSMSCHARASFNGTFRAVCLDAHWFADLDEAKQLIESWRQEYNESRLHRALNDRTPSEFTSEYAASRVFTAT